MTLLSFAQRFHPCLIVVVTAAVVTGLVADLHAARIPMTPEHWSAPSGKVEFLQHNGAHALRVLPGAGQVVLNDLDFGNGTIEFDVQPDRPDFVSLFFRRQSSDENEIVYLRTGNVGKPTALDTLQYSPSVKGVTLWDLLGHYQSPCTLNSNTWNHIKLVVSGAQMRVFVNDTQRPVLEVPRLEGNTSTGGLALGGSAYFANLEVARMRWKDYLPSKASIPRRTTHGISGAGRSPSRCHCHQGESLSRVICPSRMRPGNPSVPSGAG